MDTKEFIQGIITNELTGCFADCSQDNIDKLVDVLNRHHEIKAKNNEVLGDVSYYYLIDGDTTATGDEYYDYDDGGVWKKLTDADEPHEFESEFHYRTRRKS